MSNALDLTKPLRRRGSHYPVVMLEHHEDGISYFAQRCSDGYWAIENAVCIDHFIENVPETRELDGWINVYEGKYFQDCLHPSKDSADRGACGNRIACPHIHITYEVGEGLS